MSCMTRRNLLIALLIFFINVGIHLPILRDYGLTWDFHFHFFAGLRLLGTSWKNVETRPLPYNYPDPRNNDDLPYGPIVAKLPSAAYLIFYEKLHWLPDDVAYHLPIVLWGAMGPAILFLFVTEATKNRRLGLLSAVILSFMPRYFADVNNNMKDIPMTVVFAANIWLMWRLLTYRRLRDLFLAAIAFAVAFNTKVNAVFLPAIFGGVILFKLPKLLKLPRSPKILVLSYFLFAPLFALIMWSLFWPDPVAKLIRMVSLFGEAANNIEVLLDGKWFCSGSTVPWYYPLWYLGITTPLLVLVGSIVGMISSLTTPLRPPLRQGYAGREGYAGQANYKLFIIFLFLWLFVPLTRYLWPKTAVLDGIRHYQEVVLPLAVFAAIGLFKIVTYFLRLTRISHPELVERSLAHASTHIRARFFSPIASGVRMTIIIVFIIYLITPIIRLHPYQITYFNELIGGPRGAVGKYDLDYWGTSQKSAIDWLNVNAPANSFVHIVMAADVASRYLRPDLLANVNKRMYFEADYVVLLNRQGFLYRYGAVEFLLQKTPVYAVKIDGVPLTWVFAQSSGLQERVPEWWAGDDPCIYHTWSTPAPLGAPDNKQNRLLK